MTYSLMGYPPKDNYEGRMYPLDWISKVGWSGPGSQLYLGL